ncbi:hypothetical protein K493DRAFT_384649 [Basidiobolus meristosporus CBS 931.73]|uniref:GST C-terminal domain-containing protein n=1 Tax=Basidiobolus meristosporus CBS 931.73 TaxID=1314790 RepID=A0A1Y1XSF7_9FUNG|nr:hypothetical protein K493DRAFT_384649 [Basidiobolus meristosporus CBS 931.73]|eukprot:ORX88689.1 hypothetical protein K493DRAFT_384649 [Basidiobolus meristosporus CBS 931.73]
MPVKFYSFKQALWPRSVRLTLAEKNITDIEILDDSTTITEYLDSNYPGTELYSTSDMVTITHWIDTILMGFSWCFLHPILLNWSRQNTPFYREKLQQTNSFLVAYKYPEQAQPLYDLHRAEWRKAELLLDQLEDQLESGPYIVGVKYTAADVHVIPLLVHLKSIKSDVVFSGRPNLQQYLTKVSSRESFKLVYDA